MTIHNCRQQRQFSACNRAQHIRHTFIGMALFLFVTTSMVCGAQPLPGAPSLADLRATANVIWSRSMSAPLVIEVIDAADPRWSRVSLGVAWVPGRAECRLFLADGRWQKSLAQVQMHLPEQAPEEVLRHVLVHEFTHCLEQRARDRVLLHRQFDELAYFVPPSLREELAMMVNARAATETIENFVLGSFAMRAWEESLADAAIIASSSDSAVIAGLIRLRQRNTAVAYFESSEMMRAISKQAVGREADTSLQQACRTAAEWREIFHGNRIPGAGNVVCGQW